MITKTIFTHIFNFFINVYSFFSNTTDPDHIHCKKCWRVLFNENEFIRNYENICIHCLKKEHKLHLLPKEDKNLLIFLWDLHAKQRNKAGGFG